MPYKNETLNWEELRLFLAVARAQGLAGATGVTGVSAPTLSRRMAHLEEELGVLLFERLQSGYALTSQGQELFLQVQEMESQSQTIQNWRKRLDPRPVVKITAGAWTSVFIARHLNSLSDRKKGPRIELLTGMNFLNFTRREADIGIRNQRPEQQGLARKRIGPVYFAIYGGLSYVKENPHSMTDTRFETCDWVVPSITGVTGASSDWLLQRIGQSARLACGTPHAMLEAIAANAGLCVLPCFIGGSDARLARCSGPIEELSHVQWLVSHNEGRKLPHVRQISQNLSQLFQRNQALFE